MNTSLWRDVPGFEGLYQVSAEGEVKSLGRYTIGGSRGGPCRKYYPARILAHVAGGRRRNRIRVNLFRLTNGSGARAQTFYVVDLVRQVFGTDVADKLPAAFHKGRK